VELPYGLFEDGVTNYSLVWRAAVLPSTFLFCVERGIQRKRAVILKSVALGPSPAQRQHRVEPVQARIAVFSSTQKMAACCGGYRYKSMMQAGLRILAVLCTQNATSYAGRRLVAHK
jgi:hypothetical protein